MEKAEKRMVQMVAVRREGEVIINGSIVHLKFYVMTENTKGQNRNRQSDLRSREELSENSGRQNASADRGGISDLDDESLTTDRSSRQERGSGLSTKREVTGSDYDGQLSGE
jgi:hypothetical protein